MPSSVWYFALPKPLLGFQRQTKALNIQLSIFDLLIIIGMAVGLTCGVLLLRRTNQKAANRFLGLGILAFVWLNTKTLLHSLHLWDIHGVGYFPNGVELALPPLFYYYVLNLHQPKRPFGGRDWWHFIPFFLSQGYATVVYLITLQARLPQEKWELARAWHFGSVKAAEEYAVVISAVYYMALALPLVWPRQKEGDVALSPKLLTELRFLQRSLIGLVALVAYSILNLILNEWLDVAHDERWKVSHLLIASLVYYMGLMGFKHSESNLSGVAPKRTVRPPQGADVVRAELKQALHLDKAYLAPDLKLADLAQRLGIPEPVLSQAIKAEYQQNFRGLLNQLRVQEVQRRLTQEGVENLSLLGLAQECGFRSEASFYRIFKEVAGCTPKQWMEGQSDGKD